MMEYNIDNYNKRYEQAREELLAEFAEKNCLSTPTAQEIIARMQQNFSKMWEEANKLPKQVFEKISGATPSKPPLGITPRYIWLENRYSAILEAMQRFAEAGKPAPVEWFEELKEVVRLMEKKPC